MAYVPSPGKREDALDEERAHQQVGELEADDREHRRHGVLERESQDDDARRHAHRLGHADVVLPHRLEHRRARHAGDDPGREGGQGERRQDQVLHGVEEGDEVARDERVDRGHAGDLASPGGSAPRRCRARPRRAAGRARGRRASCRTMARKNEGSETPPMAKTRVTWSIQRPFMCAVSAPSETPDDDRDEQREADQLERVGQEAEDVVEDRPPRADRLAPVALDEVADVDAVLHVERLVEAEDAARLGDLRRPGPGPGVDGGRVRRHDAHEQERDHRDAEEHEQQQGEAPQRGRRGRSLGAPRRSGASGLPVGSSWTGGREGRAGRRPCRPPPRPPTSPGHVVEREHRGVVRGSAPSRRAAAWGSCRRRGRGRTGTPPAPRRRPSPAPPCRLVTPCRGRSARC